MIPVKETVVRSSRLVTYSKGEKEIVRQGIEAINMDKEEGGGKSHDHIMEILQDYNAKDFKVKKGLFGWKLKTVQSNNSMSIT